MRAALAAHRVAERVEVVQAGDATLVDFRRLGFELDPLSGVDDRVGRFPGFGELFPAHRRLQRRDPDEDRAALVRRRVLLGRDEGDLRIG